MSQDRLWCWLIMLKRRSEGDVVTIVEWKQAFYPKQTGQASAEYIVVTAAIVMALMQPIDPPAGLKCPANAATCSVVQILAQTLRNRSEGYSYAISASEFPLPLVNYQGEKKAGPSEPCGGHTPCGNPQPTNPPGGAGLDVTDSSGNVIGHAIGSNVYDDNGDLIGTVTDNGDVIDSNGDVIGTTSAGGLGAASGTAVAVDLAGKQMGTLDKDGFVVNDLKVKVGKKDPKSDDVLKIDASEKIIVDKDNNPTVIGHVGKLNADGDVVDAKGKVISTK